MRTLIDIPADDLERLDALARRDRQSRVAAVRDGVCAHPLGHSEPGWIACGQGRWRELPGPADGVLYPQEIRQDRDAD
ncbi:MAG: CopG family transcriptional regulator [Thermaurantiacus tibetensis]|uniref:CopG family transcriptional regulator n=1 Tax=Thermaurantiacus tibetensis TaxID=2759035 RepID=UPI00188E19B1|nr:CopG family transcriptional regulator [Thermaurantiacus tibetensis]